MATKLAIHERKRSYSDRWIQCCKEWGIDHEIVNCYESDIISRLRSVSGLLWQPHQTIPQDVLIAAHLIRSAEAMGLAVFPNNATFWHFDDKIAQKYLLEAVGAPLVKTHVFFDLQEALSWVDQTTFPKVFKLKRGAGSFNVQLVRDADHARRLCRKAFGSGFKPVAGYLADLATKGRKMRRKGDYMGKLRRLPASVRAIRESNRLMGREKGYAYFQDFVPGNPFDTRVAVIGKRAFAFTRDVRPHDFRASGSGSINYDLNRIGTDCVRIAFDVARKIGSQSVAIDFLRDPDQGPVLTEISYGYMSKPVYDCAGHWDESLNWHEGHEWPEDMILTDLINSIKGA
jgi:glutathione synthase/RimK-type ligase-like ATP-grasp enzyme